MERSFLDYAMSVIVSRALPDVRDGLKPVHRRILYGMFEQGVRPDRPHKKCARMVGDVMGKYHPHGDGAIYDALVRMAQDFSLRYPLIDGHGNFGSPDFGAAAMRYTECRLAPLAMQMIEGIDEETVDFVDNYDGEEQEPFVLPARFPNLLVNGAGGIAVGMATNIPPHNMSEICSAVDYYLDNPECTPDDLAKIVRGPDFPTGGVIMGRDGIMDAFRTGRGSVKIRAKASIEEDSKGRPRIVVTELPYQVSANNVLLKIKDLVESKRVEGISDLRDETSREGTRLVVELKRDAIPQVVLNQLYKYTQLQDSFGVNMLALVGGRPRTLNLAEMIGYYVDHQVEVIERRTRYRLRKAEERLHIVEGLLIALDNIDEVIKIIRGSEDTDAARTALMIRFGLSEIQANHILDMPLRRLTQLETSKLRDEAAELNATIADLKAILDDPSRVRELIRTELAEVKEKFGDARRTVIGSEDGDFDIEDLVADEDLVITLSRNNYIKAVPAASYRTQNRGGRGVSGGKLKDEDVLDHIIHTTAHAFLLFFSNTGKVYRIKAHEVPKRDRTARGVVVQNVLPLHPDERIQAIIDTRDYETYRFLVIATKNGTVKKTAFNAYDSSRRDGIIALTLKEGDEVVAVLPTSGTDNVLMVSRAGQGICFAETDARPMGRTAGGVRGMNLAPDDYVVSAIVAAEGSDLLLVTTSGHGKRTPVKEFGSQKRGGKGRIAIKLPATRGKLVGGVEVVEGQDVILTSTDGQVIRVSADGISRQGRPATGVSVMKLDRVHEVAAITSVPVESEGSDEVAPD
ncbi:MAG: DNA gyrase subunit A [Acidobacteria bacterium]|nr:MAG: DNA gyrase subunit A [Acidobacteriota bacterium]